jgi:hypothetical protein
MHGEARVAAQQIERWAASRLRDELRAQIRRPDRVRFGHRRGAAAFVAPHGEREAEGEDQPDDPEERALEDPERLAQRGRVLAQVPAAHVAGQGRGGDHREDDQRQLPCAEREEQLVSSRAGLQSRLVSASMATVIERMSAMSSPGAMSTP